MADQVDPCPPGFIGRVCRWLDERLKTAHIIEYMSRKTVPRHRYSGFYYFGGITLLLFVVQVMTGILLLMYYRVGADSSYESVYFIITEVPFGWLIRSLHAWSANIMILFAFLHMFTTFFTLAYRKPRELTWLGGVGLLVLALAFGFSGYLLPWNELSFSAVLVGTGMARVVPLIGEELMVILRGGEDVTIATIGRFFGFHVAILPALFTVFLAVHLLLVQRQGMSEPIEWEGKPVSKKKYQKFFPNYLYRELLIWMIVLNGLALLAVFFPDGVGPFQWPLGNKADPFAPPPAVIRPEWYLVFAYKMLELVPGRVLSLAGDAVTIIILVVGGFIWAMVPFLDRKSKVNQRSRLFCGLGILVAAFLVLMTVLGYM